jgi:hypothetical protein
MRLAKFYLAITVVLTALYLLILALRENQALIQVVGLKLGHGTVELLSIVGMAFGAYLAVKTVKEELAVQGD